MHGTLIADDTVTVYEWLCVGPWWWSSRTHHSIVQKWQSKFTRVSLPSVFRVSVHRRLRLAIDGIGHCLDSCSPKQFENHVENISRHYRATSGWNDCKLCAQMTVSIFASMTLYKMSMVAYFHMSHFDECSMHHLTPSQFATIGTPDRWWCWSVRFWAWMSAMRTSEEISFTR